MYRYTEGSILVSGRKSAHHSLVQHQTYCARALAGCQLTPWSEYIRLVVECGRRRLLLVHQPRLISYNLDPFLVTSWLPSSSQQRFRFAILLSGINHSNVAHCLGGCSEPELGKLKSKMPKLFAVQKYIMSIAILKGGRTNDANTNAKHN